MALLRRQSPTYASLDDQGPEMWGSFVGNWTHNTTPSQGFYNYTFTATQTPGASLSFRFSGMQASRLSSTVFHGTYVMVEIGSQAWIYGSRTANGTNGVTIYYPTADYTVDGASGESLTSSTSHRGAYLASHYSRFSTTIDRKRHGEDHLLPDTTHGRRSS